MLVLTRSEVARLFPMAAALDAVRRAAADYVAGHAQVPARVRIEVPEAHGEMLFMPGRLTRAAALGLKVVGAFRGNPVLGLPVSLGAVLLMDPKTGEAVALLDATHVTDVRTGAMTGVACEHLAREDAAVLGLIGSGAQARTQLEGVAAVRALREVRVWSRSAERVAGFVEEARLRYPALDIRPSDSPEAAARGADIVVAATTSATPVVADEWIAPGTLVCGVGSHTPDAAEIAPGIVARAARIVVDTRRGAVEGAGDISGPLARGLCPPDRVHELGELVLGQVPGRRSRDEVTVFKSVGFAAVDLYAATVIVRAATARGLGRELDIHG